MDLNTKIDKYGFILEKIHSVLNDAVLVNPKHNNVKSTIGIQKKRM